jgi:hypothetical protein
MSATLDQDEEIVDTAGHNRMWAQWETMSVQEGNRSQPLSDPAPYLSTPLSEDFRGHN